MEFKHTFTPAEVKLFKDIGGIKTIMTKVINRTITQRKSSLDDATIESRTLKVLSKSNAMRVGDIVRTYNTFFAKPVSLNYMRSVLSGMIKTGLITRPSHGKYIKAGG